MENEFINNKDFYYFPIAHSETEKSIRKCEYNVLFYCEEGSAIVEINYQRYNIKPRTTAIFLFKEVVSRLYVSKDFSGKCVAFLPSLLMMESRNYDFSFLSALRRNPVITWDVKYADFIEQMFKIIDMAKEYKDETFLKKTAMCQYFCFMNLLKFYFQHNNMLENVDNNMVSSKKDYFVAFIKELVKSCRQSREVLFYANSLNISSNYLNEVCQTVCEHSAKEVIDQYVSSQLKFELYNTNKSMQNLTEEYNFPNQSYLSRYYRRMMGETPSQTRKSRSEKNLSIL